MSEFKKTSAFDQVSPVHADAPATEHEAASPKIERFLDDALHYMQYENYEEARQCIEDARRELNR
jgi:hypothetical protein